MCGWVVAGHGATACQLSFYFLTRTENTPILRSKSACRIVDILHSIECFVFAELRLKREAAAVEVLAARWLYCISMTGDCDCS